MNTTIENWWGAHRFVSGQMFSLYCADLRFSLRCEPNQWWIGYHWQKEVNQFEPLLSWEPQELDEVITDKEQRYAFAELPVGFELQPALADRPVVCRAKVSVSLLPYQEVTLFVCLPMWLQLFVDDVDSPLIDIPTVRVCDSWFGPNTRQGVISYASQVSEQLDVKPISNNKARAAIEVRLQNQSDDILTLDKISVPAPNLDLYCDSQGQLWTPRITLVRRDTDDAVLSIDEVISGNLPLSELTLITKAREDIGRSKITKAISALFG